MAEQTLQSAFKQFTDDLDAQLHDFVKSTDSFSQLRNTLLQKESSLNVLKTQSWQEDLSSSLDNLEKAVAKEFSDTETCKGELESQLSHLRDAKREVETMMKTLLGLHQKLTSCIKGGNLSFDDRSSHETYTANGHYETRYAPYSKEAENIERCIDTEKPVEEVVAEQLKLTQPMQWRDQEVATDIVLSYEKKLNDQMKEIRKDNKNDRQPSVDGSSSKRSGMFGLF